MASDSGEPDAAALRDRVAQLEQTVADQQATIESLSQPTASRRGFVKAAAGVAGLGALGIYSAYPARAQAAGQVGSESAPVDVEAYDLNVQGTANGLVQNPLTGDLDAGGNSLTNVASVEVIKADTRSGYNSVSGSRAVGTTETNDSGSDLDVRVNFRATAGPSLIRADFEIDGQKIQIKKQTYDKNDQFSVVATVSAGSDYTVLVPTGSANVTVSRWMEQQ